MQIKRDARASRFLYVAAKGWILPEVNGQVLGQA